MCLDEVRRANCMLDDGELLPNCDGLVNLGELGLYYDELV